MTILVVGGAGFIGKHLCFSLRSSFQIVVLDLECTSGVVDELKTKGIEVIHGNAVSRGLVEYIIRARNVSVVVNLAVVSCRDTSKRVDNVCNNLRSLQAILQATFCRGNVTLVHVSSDDVQVSERSPQPLPGSFLGASKAGGELIACAYNRSFGIDVRVVRLPSVYGPCQYSTELIPSLLASALRDEDLHLRGNGEQQRYHLHVWDAVRAIEVTMRAGSPGQIYAAQPCDGPYKNVDVALLALDVTSSSSRIRYTADDGSERIRLPMDDSQLRCLGWFPRFELANGMDHTLQYMVRDGSWSLQCRSFQFHNRGEDDRFLLIGSNGWIGSQLLDHMRCRGYTVHASTSRLEDRAGLLAEIDQCQPHVILNCAGVTGRPNVDWCELNKRRTIETNVYGVMNLADLCAAQGVHLMNFSTGCIYTYDSAHQPRSGNAFTEEDEPNFERSFYSYTKCITERLLSNYSNCCSLRLRMPISSDLQHPRNFINKIVQYDRLINIPNSMSVLDELIPLVPVLAARRVSGPLNFTNPGALSHNEILHMYRANVDPNFWWRNFSIEEQNEILQAPRSNNELDASRLLSVVPNLKTITESLKEYVFQQQQWPIPRRGDQKSAPEQESDFSLRADPHESLSLLLASNIPPELVQWKGLLSFRSARCDPKFLTELEAEIRLHSISSVIDAESLRSHTEGVMDATRALGMASVCHNRGILFLALYDGLYRMKPAQQATFDLLQNYANSILVDASDVNAVSRALARLDSYSRRKSLHIGD